MISAPHELTPGTTLGGKWTVERFLGEGASAEVYAARHRNGKTVAIKLLRPELARDAAIVQRFLREGYLANHVAHRGVVSVLDDDVTPGGTPFLVLEYLAGRSLQKVLEDCPAGLPIETVVAVADKVLDVLVAAHAKGIVHRDIKPENLFLTEEEDVRVLDFGVARLVDPQSQSPNATQLWGGVVGTPVFMPPEQALGHADKVDAQSDLWALAATLVTLLSGRPLREAETLNEALLLAMTTPVKPVSELCAAIPASLAGVLDRALAFEKIDRYPTAEAMRDGLHAAMQASGFDTQRRTSLPTLVADAPPIIPQTPLPWSLVGAGVAVMVLTVMGWAGVFSSHVSVLQERTIAHAPALPGGSVDEPARAPEADAPRAEDAATASLPRQAPPPAALSDRDALPRTAPDGRALPAPDAHARAAPSASARPAPSASPGTSRTKAPESLLERRR